MIPPAKADILAAIDVLTTSYSYERERWRSAYVTLREVEREFGAQLKPYDWIAHVFLGLGMATWIAMMVFWLGNQNTTWIMWAVLVVGPSIPAGLLSFGGWLRLRSAARRHPILLLKPQITVSLNRYRELAVPSTPEKHA